MTAFIAALPMYDWPETRDQTDAEWDRLRDALERSGIAAPAALVRENRDMPPVAGGIRDAAGRPVAPDPATLPPDGLDFHTLWRHPDLLLAQTCWGPMELGLAELVTLVGQPSYDGIEGGGAKLYSSAILMRGDGVPLPGGPEGGVSAPAGGQAILPLDLLRGRRFAFNGPDSMSGIMGLAQDLQAAGEGLDIFSERIATGGHRASIAAVAEGGADVCAVDCRSWQLARRHEPAADRVRLVGWTAKRLGLPMITSRRTPAEVVAELRKALGGMLIPERTL